MLGIVCSCMVIVLSLAAVFMDLAYEKVDNQLIVFGLVLGVGYQFYVYGIRGLVIFLIGIVLPFITLYLLFFFRMLGSGDIKLLSVLGGFIGPFSILKCIFMSLILGAVLSIGVLCICGNWAARFQYFADYVQQLLVLRKTKGFWVNGTVFPYYRKGKRMENIPFTVPIFMSMVLYAGGLLR